MESPAPGILLIADPFLKDPNFKRTVVFLCEHQDEGSFGFVLNKNYDYTLNELVSGLDDLRLPVYLGGPVQMDTIHFLHQYPAQIPGGTEVAKGIFWGGDFETALQLIRNGEADSSKIRFFIGYSGWGEGQLDEEMTRPGWFAADGRQEILFETPTAERWEATFRAEGIDPKLLDSAGGAA